MYTHQPRPTTPQPPQGGGGGGGGGFSAILSLPILHRNLRHGIICRRFVFHRHLQYYRIRSLISIAFALAPDRSRYLFYSMILIYNIYNESNCWSTLCFLVCFNWFVVKYDLLAKHACLLFTNWIDASSYIVLSEET